MRRCVVVDHDPDLLEALELMLNELGFETVAGPAGTITFQTIYDAEPHLLVFDLPFNQDDFWMLLDVAQTDPVLRNIPALCLSTSEEELCRARRRYDFPGGVRMLTKPFDLGALEAAVRNLVDERSCSAEAAH